MSERTDLLTSVAKSISSYREGEIETPSPAHVDKWVSQFTPENQILFLKEFDHVMKQTFIEKSDVIKFLDGLLENKKLVVSDPLKYWSESNFLCIQHDGKSQKHMLALLGERVNKRFGLSIDKSGSEKGDFIYLDDVLFSGNRIGTDLEDWIANKAPVTANVQVILIALHTSGHFYLSQKRLAKAISDSKKNIQITYWRHLDLENQLYWKNKSDVLWPAAIPDDSTVREYIDSEKRFPLQLRVAGGTPKFFSSEAGRNVLEQEFLRAGVKIRSQVGSPKANLRPLGFSLFGVGFGSLIATYRNCPNNCPLAMWWGDPEAKSGPFNWYPLLPRKTYGAIDFSEV